MLPGTVRWVVMGVPERGVRAGVLLPFGPDNECDAILGYRQSIRLAITIFIFVFSISQESVSMLLVKGLA